MINIISRENHRKLRTEHRLRTISVALWILSVVFVVSGVLLVPVYQTAHDQAQSIERYMSIEEETRATAKNDDSMKIARITSSHISVALANTPLNIAAIVEDVVAQREVFQKSITLTSFEYTADNKQSTLRISGITLNTTVLGEFKKALEKTGLFTRVTLPVSNLADGEGRFSLTLEPRAAE